MTSENWLVSGHDYHRTVVAYHGTRINVAEALVRGEPFMRSENGTDWLGHGIYFWEHAPRQAWLWAEQRYEVSEAAVVGAIIRLGHCVDLLDPENGVLLDKSYAEVESVMADQGADMPRNRNKDKYLDCAVFNYLYGALEDVGTPADSCRAVFVPTGRQQRYWKRSGVYRGSHIQICMRNAANILAVWHVGRNQPYGLG